MRPNIFEAKCHRCGGMVKPEKGWTAGKTGKQWRVVHDECIPKGNPDKYRKLEYDL